MGLGSAAYGVAIALAVLFASAVVHKLMLVRAGTADADPLIARRAWTARRAKTVAACVASGEALLVGALAAMPSAGLAAASLTLLVYGRELRQIRWDAPCHCFAVTTRATAVTAALRDLALAVLAGVSAAIVWVESGGARVGWLSLLVAVATLVGVYLGEAAALRHHQSSSGGATAA
jgi:hypothetical protein